MDWFHSTTRDHTSRAAWRQWQTRSGTSGSFFCQNRCRRKGLLIVAQVIDKNLVNVFRVLPPRFGTPFRRRNWIEHVDFNARRFDVERAFDPRLVRTVNDDWDDRQSGGGRDVDKPELKRHET